MALTAGSVVDGRYTLFSRLGDGTFGEVWRAGDQRLSGRPVAVKFLKVEFSDRADVVARFEAEVDALARLAHPNVVAVFDRGRWNDRRFFVMEFVDAITLRAWLDAGRREQRRPGLIEVRRIFEGLCAGVEAAHSVTVPGPIVHRDLKPDNVLLQVRPGAETLVKVLDFGVAQLGGRHGTNTGMLLGTPDYMAPEQAMGTVSNIGPWTDVFSLAVVLFEMLTLSPRPKETEVWWGTSLAQSTNLRAILLQSRGDVPPEVWDVIARALHSDSAVRPPNARVFSTELRAAWESIPRSAIAATTELHAVSHQTVSHTVAIPEFTMATALGTASTVYSPGPVQHTQTSTASDSPPWPGPVAATTHSTTTPHDSFSTIIIASLAFCLLIAIGAWFALRSDATKTTTTTVDTAPTLPAPSVPTPSAAPAAPTPAPSPTVRRDNRPDPERTYTLNFASGAPCLGPETAPVTLDHISDFQCPFCARVNPTLDRVRQTYGDRVRLCWHDYPLPFHRLAMPAAELAREVRQQLGDSYFWRFHDQVFASQSSMSEASLLSIATDLGANERRLRRALASHTHQPAVLADKSVVDSLGLTIGTPTTFINGRAVVGAQPYEAFATAIDSALAQTH